LDGLELDKNAENPQSKINEEEQHDGHCYMRIRNKTKTCCDGWIGDTCSVACSRHDLFFLHRKFIRSIRDAAGKPVQASLISSTSQMSRGWAPRSDIRDFIDIRLENPIKLLEFSVRGEETNVQSFGMTLTDTNDVVVNITSVNDRIQKFSSHRTAVKGMKFWPIEKLDEKLPYNIKLDIISCTGK
jgi:hypothetical protein